MVNICKCGIAAVDCDYHRPTDKFTERAKKVGMLPEGVPIIVDTTSGKPKVIDPASVDVWNPVTGLMEPARAIDVGPLNWPRPMTIDDLIKAEQHLRAAKIPEFIPAPSELLIHRHDFDRASFDFSQPHLDLSPEDVAHRAFLMTPCRSVQIHDNKLLGAATVELFFNAMLWKHAACTIGLPGVDEFRKWIEENRLVGTSIDVLPCSFV
jgi:hypothetical protein